MELKCSVQNYEWGKFGLNSTVAKLVAASNPDVNIDNKKTYAELWMGTHPSGPSIIKSTNQKLGDWILDNPKHLGDSVTQKFGNQLPFLFKVLSIEKALSIQAHPEKLHAERLHAERPDIYKDPNHKPELAVALTPFEALCGFRPLAQIKSNITSIPELKNVIGEESSAVLLSSSDSNYEFALKKCFHSLYHCPDEKIKEQLNALLQRVKTLDKSTREKINADLLEKLASEFPGDVGCFSLYFLNVLTLKPGESLYLGPNEPHAYLSGDCIECMACSDNVVRAGLTPKYKDVETLCEMLKYKCESADSKRFQPTVEDNYSAVFKPPVPDFAVAIISIPTSLKQYNLISRTSASIIIVIKGNGSVGAQNLQPGTILFFPANDHTIINIENDLLMFQAFCST